MTTPGGTPSPLQRRFPDQYPPIFSARLQKKPAKFWRRMASSRALGGWGTPQVA
jgi:hypothetical protein